jgi:DNA-directed RNA polymerase specialized sigma24 family protein
LVSQDSNDNTFESNQEETSVDGTATSSGQWGLTQSSLQKFLACLDLDPDRAGEKYELMVKFFDWRGARFPEECADETINRVIRKVDEGETFRDIGTYCQGVARLVYLESLKYPENRGVGLNELPAMAAPVSDAEGEDERQSCFNHCMQELPFESRQLILKYYQDDRRKKINNRLALAEQMGIPLNALRSRAQRIRDRLERCVSKCMKKNL